MKCVIACFLFVLFTLVQQDAFSRDTFVAGGKMAMSKEILLECTSVQKFFQSLDVDSARLLNSVLRENYAAGYYSELLRFSDNAHYAEVEAHLLMSEEQLNTLKNSKAYHSILHQARGTDKHHLIRFIVGRREAGMIHGNSTALRKWVNESSPALSVKLNLGYDCYWGTLFFGGVYTPSIRGHQYLEAKDVFPPYVHYVHKAAPKPARSSKSKLRKFDLSRVSAEEVRKISFVALLALLAVAATVSLIGAYCFPHLPGFRRMRMLLEH